MQKRIISLAIALLLAFGLFGCAAQQEAPQQEAPVQATEETTPEAVVQSAEETAPEAPVLPDAQPSPADDQEPAPPLPEDASGQILPAQAESSPEPAESSQEPAENPSAEIQTPEEPKPAEEPASSGLADGTYSIAVGFSGGTGKARINSPATLIVTGGQYYAKLVWTSVNYDYMIVGGVKYLNENNGGYSTFTVPVPAMDTYVSVIGDTLAMSTPHEVEYTLYFDSTSIQ